MYIHVHVAAVHNWGSLDQAPHECVSHLTASVHVQCIYTCTCTCTYNVYTVYVNKNFTFRFVVRPFYAP